MVIVLPLMRCQRDGEAGWKWGEDGYCYLPSEEGGDDEARESALAQARAMGYFDNNMESSVNKASNDYVRAFFDRVKGVLPSWMYQDIHREAMGSAGGKARWKKDEKLKNSNPQHYEIGQRVEILDPHMEGHDFGIIAEMREVDAVYGLVIDGHEDMGVHLWYIGDELQLAEGNDYIGNMQPSSSDVHVDRPIEIIDDMGVVSGYIHKNIMCNISKVDDEKRVVYGIVLEPDVEDAQGDIISASEIEKTAHRFMKESRIIGEQHQRAVQAEVVESYISPDNLVINRKKVKSGSWVMAVKVHDDKLWKGVKDGLYTGFSVGGYGLRKECI